MGTWLNQSEASPATAATAEWQVAVAYEDPQTRGRAMHLVQRLQKRFAAELDFSTTWWRFRYLGDPDIALVARHYASAADIIIVSTDAPGLFPLPIMNWIESWTAARRKPGGVLVPLIGSPHIPSQLFSTKLFYLRHVADRAQMDFLPQSAIPAVLEDPSPDNPLPSLPRDQPAA